MTALAERPGIASDAGDVLAGETPNLYPAGEVLPCPPPGAPALAYPSGAVEVLPPGAPRDVWLAERQRSLGGSDASLMAGVNGFGSRVELYLEKTGRLPAEPPSGRMEWGIRHERTILEYLAEVRGLRLVKAGMLRRPGYPYGHANPDAIEVNALGIPTSGVECKTAGWRMAHEWDDDQIADHAECQAQWCMAITGLRRWWVVVLIDGWNPQLRLVHADDELQATLLREGDKFWREHVLADAMPAIDDSTATHDAVKRAFPTGTGRKVALTDGLRDLFADLAAAKAAKAAAEADERAAWSAIRAVLGDAEHVVDDPKKPLTPKGAKARPGDAVLYASCPNDGAFSEKAFRQLYPEFPFDAYTVPRPALDVERVKADHPEKYTAARARTLRTKKTLTAPAPVPSPEGH